MRLISPLSPSKYSDMSPMHEDASQVQAADEDRGVDEFLAQATRAPTMTLPIDDTDGLAQTAIDKRHRRDLYTDAQYPPWYIIPQYIEPASLAVDENDGPTSFNHSPSILDFTGGKSTNKTERKTQTLFE
ncbi:uncharacterized protein LOC112592012 [Melanaphis sacchari]|uniref:uncharacterized protein LOC112592012 n=1 Tax=Melanaphis sacchari TaxID=742174 RepID=UPI000DC1350D|nr:uncharacterized protein LOC112592012 [Melanaphis sacchari]